MEKTNLVKINFNSTSTHRGVERSSTLNRRYVKRPTKILINDEQPAEAMAAESAKAPAKIMIEESSEKAAKAKAAEISTPKIQTRKAVSYARASEYNYSSKIGHIKAASGASSATKAEMPAEKAATLTPAPRRIADTPDLPPAENPYKAFFEARKKAASGAAMNAASSRELKDAAIARAMSEMEEREEIVKNMKSKKSMKREAMIAKREAMMAKREAAMAKKREAMMAKKASKQTVMMSMGNESMAEKIIAAEMAESKEADKKAKKEVRHFKKHRGKRIILALAASSACMLALAMIVRINLPDISVKVAAIQTGIEATYPNYVPRGFSLTGVYTDNRNSVIIDFNNNEGKTFSISEEKSSWDSNALQNNYVKSAYGSHYNIVREQGLTIYISYSNASWVNNGILFKLTAKPNTLTEAQIKNIATSL